MKNKTRILFAAFILILALMACGGSAPATPNQSVETMVQTTLQALTAAVPATITPKPATTFAPLPFTIEPTLAPPTSIVDLSSAKPIYFETGATSASVPGTIQPNQIITYSLFVTGDQPALISVGSKNNDVTISVYDQQKNELLSPNLKHSNWQGYFSKQGRYFVKVYGGAATSNFTLITAVFARVKFEPGTTEIKLRGSTVKGSIITYALKADQGKTMEVTINTRSDAAAFTVWGFTDGQPYARAAAGTTSFSMLLPTTQDYIIDVVPQSGKVVDYVLKISIK